MTNLEEITLRLGYDASSVQRGTQIMLDGQKKAAMEYVDVWNRMLGKRDAAEVASNEASLARLKVNLEKKAALQKAWMEKQAAMAVIAGGSGGYGSGFATAEQKAAGVAVEKGESKLEDYAVAGVGGFATGVGIKSLSHVWKLVKSVLTLNVEGVGHSLLMLGKHLIGFASVIPVLGAGIVGIEGNLSMRKQLKEMDAGYGTAAGMKATEKNISERLRKMIAEGVRQGKISPAIAESLGHSLGHGMTGIGAVQRDLSTRGIVDKETYELQKKATREQEEADKRNHERFLRESKVNEEEAEKRKKEHARLAEELPRQYDTLLRDSHKIIHEMGGLDQETPTIEDLAGRNFTGSLNKRYGKGGRFDLGAGNGPFARIARQYELAQKQQMWDIIHGNAVFDKDGTLIGGAAYGDKQRQIAAHNALAGAGLETPAMKMEDMIIHLADIQKNMADLASAANNEGIKIRDGQ